MQAVLLTALTNLLRVPALETLIAQVATNLLTKLIADFVEKAKANQVLSTVASDVAAAATPEAIKAEIDKILTQV